MNCLQVISCFDEMYRAGACYSNTDAISHVTSCPACGKAYREWCGVARQLQDTPAIVPSDDFELKLKGAVEKEMAASLRRPATILFFPQRLAWAALFLLALCGLFAVNRYYHNGAALSSKAGEEFTKMHFAIAVNNATVVTLVGDFNGWDIEKNRLRKTADGTWKINLRVPKGSYQYLFLVDGKEWRADPLNTHQVPDGFGGINSEITI